LNYYTILSDFTIASLFGEVRVVIGNLCLTLLNFWQGKQTREDSATPPGNVSLLDKVEEALYPGH
jgi:hypothetical protein